MTDEELAEKRRKEFLGHLRELVKYWSNVDGRTTEEKISGAIFSTLCAIDGVAGAVPYGYDLVNLEDGKTINADVYLHDLFYEEDK